LLERWRRNVAHIDVELKRPPAIDAVPIDFLRGEPVRARRGGSWRVVCSTSPAPMSRSAAHPGQFWS